MYCNYCGKIGYDALNCAYCGQKKTFGMFAGQTVTDESLKPFKLNKLSDPPNPNNILAYIGLILSCLIATAPLGLIFGIFGLYRSDRIGDSGEKLSILAIQISGVVLLFCVFFVLPFAAICSMFLV